MLLTSPNNATCVPFAFITVLEVALIQMILEVQCGEVNSTVFSSACPTIRSRPVVRNRVRDRGKVKVEVKIEVRKIVVVDGAKTHRQINLNSWGQGRERRTCELCVAIDKLMCERQSITMAEVMPGLCHG